MAVRFSQYSSYIDVLAELVIAIVLHKPFCPILGQYEHLRGIARFSKSVASESQGPSFLIVNSRKNKPLV